MKDNVLIFTFFLLYLIIAYRIIGIKTNNYLISIIKLIIIFF